MTRFGGITGNNIHLKAGQEYDLPEELAQEVIRDGRGVLVAEVRPRENAAKRTTRPKAER
jgi:hypothetical protein